MDDVAWCSSVLAYRIPDSGVCACENRDRRGCPPPPLIEREKRAHRLRVDDTRDQTRSADNAFEMLSHARAVLVPLPVHGHECLCVFHYRNVLIGHVCAVSSAEHSSVCVCVFRTNWFNYYILIRA